MWWDFSVGVRIFLFLLGIVLVIAGIVSFIIYLIKKAEEKGYERGKSENKSTGWFHWFG